MGKSQMGVLHLVFMDFIFSTSCFGKIGKIGYTIIDNLYYLEGQMKKIIAIGCLMLGVMLMGTACGRSQYNAEEVMDEAVIHHLNELAKENLEKYFDITVNEHIKMTGSVKKYIPKDETTGLKERLILLEKQEGEPIEGQLYSYQIMVDSNTDEVKGLYYGMYSTKEPGNYTEEQLDEIGRAFIKEKQMIPEGETLSLLKVEKVRGADYIEALTYQYGEHYLLVNVNTQDGKVMSFEYSA